MFLLFLVFSQGAHEGDSVGQPGAGSSSGGEGGAGARRVGGGHRQVRDRGGRRAGSGVWQRAAPRGGRRTRLDRPVSGYRDFDSVSRIMLFSLPCKLRCEVVGLFK